MEGGKVFFSDLFDSGIGSGIEGLVGQINEVRNALLSMVSDVKRQASEMNNALAGISSVTKADRDATSAYASEIERLHKDFEALSKAIGLTNTQLEEMAKRKTPSPKAEVDLTKAYASLSDLIAKTGVNLKDLLSTQRQQAIAEKNGKAAADSLSGSYNQLYAQYNLVKNVLNAMGKEMRENSEIGKVWEAQALDLMNTMKGMQEATGKHTLSVGDYTKAFNGLSISTQQVLRELPTLANSWSQFFIAISNNVPIFVDNLKRVQQETGSWTIAMKGVVSSIFSWQTGLLVILTLLPSISKKIKENSDRNRELKESLDLVASSTKALAKAMDDAIVAGQKAMAETETYIHIARDENRSMNDRIMAARNLKIAHEEELEGVSELDIVMGRYGDTLDRVKDKLQKYAEMQAYLSAIQNEYEEIAKLTAQNLRNDERSIELKGKLAEETSKLSYQMAEETEQLSFATIKAGQYDAEIRQLAEDTDNNNKKMESARNIITKLADAMPSVLDVKGGTGTKERLKELADYYYEFYESLIRTSTSGEEQEIALSNLAFEKKIDGYKKALAEIKGNSEEEKKQRVYLNNLLVNLEIERQDTERNIQIKYDEIRRKEAEKRRKEAYNASVKEADNQLKIATNQADIEHRNIVRANKDKGKAEVAYWEERIRLAKEYGGEYLKDLELFESNLEKARKKAETGVDSASGKTSKKRTGGFLYSFLYGEAEREDKPVEELANFVSNLESMKDKAIGFLNDMIDKRIELAEVAVEAAQKETEAAKTALDYEMEARANGYANNVELARKEYEERLAAEKNAIKEKEKLQKQQEAINSAIQVSDLVTATASILKNYAGIPIVGQILALAAIAAMWGTFAAAKVTAAQMTQYGEGMSEYLDYGGSHASGNDIDFGVDKRGRHRRVERGEMIGVINKRNVEKYGVNTISGIIDSLNKGTFENKYTLADVVAPEMNADLYHLAFAGLERDMTDLGGVESKLQTLVEQGETRVVTTPYGRIEYKGNNKRIIRNS